MSACVLEKVALADKCPFFNIVKDFFRQTERRLLICRELTTGDQMVVKPDLTACQQSTLLCAVSIVCTEVATFFWLTNYFQQFVAPS